MKDNEELIHYEKEVIVKVSISQNFTLDDALTETWDPDDEDKLMAECRKLVERDLSNGLYTEQFFISEVMIDTECLTIRTIPKEHKRVSSVVEFLEGDIK